MVRKVLFTVVFLMCLTGAFAKKVKLTIDGKVSPNREKIYIMVNNDTANVMTVQPVNGSFSVRMTVDANDFVRIFDSEYMKDWPDRNLFVLIPDSKHITVDGRDYSNLTIQGSPMSAKLQLAIKDSRQNSAEGFHIDVFSDNKEEWAKAREREQAIRKSMKERQLEDLRRIIKDNGKNLIPVWLIYIYGKDWQFRDDMLSLLEENPKLKKHILLQALLAK